MEPTEPAPLVLVVDDNEQNRALAAATLEDEGYQVVLANDGEQALARFTERQPDCVLLDVRMPNLDGFAVCSRIRELPGGAETPVVFLTALRDVDTFDAALRAGGDDFLTKPVRPTELVLRVQAALRLRRLNAANREYYELVRRQRDDLMRVQLQKERLMAFVVHDLKNPVNVIDLHAQLLLRQKQLTDGARAAGVAIRDEVRALMRLILNLLEISKSEEGRLTPLRTTVDPRSLVAEVAESLLVRARAKNVRIEQQVELESVDADPALLGRIVENLLENAIRHAPEDSVVRVQALERDGAWQVRISDAGPGVPPELAESIFERFVQANPEGGATRTGHGLGLAFCRLAVEAHGGRIWVEPGAPGAVFCFEVSRNGGQ